MVKKFLVFLLCGPIPPWNFVVIAIDALYNNILNKVKKLCTTQRYTL